MEKFYAKGFRIILLRLCITLLFIFLVASSVFAQSVLTKKITEAESERSLTVVFNNLENEYPVHFYYLPEWIASMKILKTHEGMSLEEVLETLFHGTELTFMEWDNHSIVLVKDPTASLKKREILEKAFSEQKIVEQVQLGKTGTESNRKNANLTGRIFDGKNTSPLPGVSISIVNLNLGVVSDTQGNFKINIPVGKHVLDIMFSGYEEKIIDLEIFDDSFLEISLHEIAKMLDEIVVTEKSASKIATSKVGQQQISITDVKRAPSFLGMTDIIKQVQTQSGVTTVSEASSGFNVRGGSADQNLVLFDDVPIFNTSHALGFFTAFNAESVNRATFYKGGIPAEFGGRISSVLDLSAKEGSYEKWNGSGGLGFITSDLTVGGPIKKDTSALTISVRSSYSDWALDLLKSRYQNIAQSSVFFYDASFKYSQKINSKSKLIVSGYTSYDKFKLSNDTINQWQNLAISVRYDHTIRNNFYYSLGLYAGHYQYTVIEEEPTSAFKLHYNITYPSLKLDFTKEGAVHKIQYGAQLTYYMFMPGSLEPTTGESITKAQEMQKELALETGIYISESFKLNERFTIDAGLRLSIFTRFGPGLVYHYTEGQPLEVQNTIDSTSYGSGEAIKTYVGPEPRLSLQYLVTKQSSIKLSYNHMYQYIHLVSNTASVTPVDIWQSSNTYFKPQQADQVSIGYFTNTENNKYEMSIEGFYKRLKNQLDFKDGASLILNKQLETALLRGIGKSYGVELVINKLSGKFTWGVNYTFSRSLRKVNGAEPSEQINEGNWYPSNYDQPHIANLNWRLSLTRKIFFTGFFTYHTGRPVSLPVGTYDVGGTPVTDFSDRNNYRIPDYHRLDLALIIEGNNKKRKRWESSWAFSFYNVYGRKNPYSVYFADQGGGTLVPFQLSLVGTIVPSVTYRFKF